MGINKSTDTFSAVSLSGGKDSSCLLILMIEKGLPIDSVLYADTTMEFPEMEDHIAKLDDFLFRERGIHISLSQSPLTSVSALRRKLHSLPCSASPHKIKNFAGSPMCGIPTDSSG